MKASDRLLLRALRREPTERAPVWLMRQAGRYLPEYRAVRAEAGGFLEMIREPKYAAEVTLQPVRRFGMDAAILFSDILVPLEAMGMQLVFDENGPSLPTPVRDRAAIDALRVVEPAQTMPFVGEALRLTRAGLSDETALLGFCGAPFTLASYAIEGGGSKEYLHTKKLMYADEGAFSALMGKLADAVGRYLSAQVDAGAEVVQLFDSWIGTLSVEDYVRYVQPHTRRALAPVKGRVPIIHFGTGNPALYPALRDAGGDVIGIDARADLGATWDQLGDVAVQGNLESASLLGAPETLFRKTDAVLAAARGRPGHVFNLGHGILPSATIATARALVDYVHEKSARSV